MQNNRIIILVNHQNWSHARVTSDVNFLLIEHGFYHMGIFHPKSFETIYYTDHPEIADVCKRGAWDLQALNALVDNPESRIIRPDKNSLYAQFIAKQGAL